MLCTRIKLNPHVSLNRHCALRITTSQSDLRVTIFPWFNRRLAENNSWPRVSEQAQDWKTRLTPPFKGSGGSAGTIFFVQSKSPDITVDVSSNTTSENTKCNLNVSISSKLDCKTHQLSKNTILTLNSEKETRPRHKDDKTFKQHKQRSHSLATSMNFQALDTICMTFHRSRSELLFLIPKGFYSHQKC